MKSSERALTRMEQLGPVTVREIIASGGWPANYRDLAEEWLRVKDKEFRNTERNEPQIALEPSPRASARQSDVAESSSVGEAALARIKQLGAQTAPGTISFGRWPANYRALAQASLDKAKQPQESAGNEAQTRLAHRTSNDARQPRSESNSLAASTAALAESGPRKIRLWFALWLASLLALLFVVIAAALDFNARHAASPIQIETSNAVAKSAPIAPGR